MSVAPDLPLRSERAALALIAFVVLAFGALWLFTWPWISSSPQDAGFSAARVRLWLEGFGELKPRPGGSVEHARFRERLVESLRELGCDVQVQETLTRGRTGRIAVVRNVVARQFGDRPGSAVLLCAHYDSVGASPGAADDAAGCASLLEIARVLGEQEPLARPIVYLLSDAEEVGMVGAEAFLAEHAWAANVGCVINLEARGVRGPSLMFEQHGGAAAIDAFARSAVRPFASSLADTIYKLMPNDTDLSVFAARGIPGFNFAFADGLANYHTRHDNLSELSDASVQHQGEQALALARELAGTDLSAFERRDVVYTDVFGWRMVSWPPRTGVLFAVAVLALTSWLVRRSARELEVSLPGALWASASVLGAAALAVGAVGLAFTGLAAIQGSPDAGARTPIAALGLVVLIVASAFHFVAARASRRLAFRSVWIALGSALALAALTSSFVFAAASFLTLPIAALWCAVEIVAAPGRQTLARSAWRRPAALWALALLQVALWVPIQKQFAIGLSYRFPIALAAPSAAVLATLWPAFSLASATMHRRLARLASLAAAAVFVFIAFAGSRAHAGREWSNLRYIGDGVTGRATIELSTFGARIPTELAEGAEWVRATQPPFPWLTLDPSMYVIEAPFEGSPPLIEVLSQQTTHEGRALRCRLRSVRGAPRLHLHLPAEVELRAVEWRGRRIDAGLESVKTQLFFAFTEDGLEVELLDRAAAPSRAYLLDQDWSAPACLHELQARRDGGSSTPRSDGDVVVLGAAYELR